MLFILNFLQIFAVAANVLKLVEKPENQGVKIKLNNLKPNELPDDKTLVGFAQLTVSEDSPKTWQLSSHVTKKKSVNFVWLVNFFADFDV